MKSISLVAPSVSTTTTTTSSACFNGCIVPMIFNHEQRSPCLQSLKKRSCLVDFNLKVTSRSIKIKAGLSGNVEATGVPTPNSVPVRVAHELLLAGHRYLDVRTPEEFKAGHAHGAINVPYMYKVGSGMTKNERFLEEVALRFRKDDEIIVGCQLGKRSMMAAKELVASGYSTITDIAGGYVAWVENGLPTDL